MSSPQSIYLWPFSLSYLLNLVSSKTDKASANSKNFSFLCTYCSKDCSVMFLLIDHWFSSVLHWFVIALIDSESWSQITFMPDVGIVRHLDWTTNLLCITVIGESCLPRPLWLLNYIFLLYFNNWHLTMAGYILSWWGFTYLYDKKWISSWPSAPALTDLFSGKYTNYGSQTFCLETVLSFRSILHSNVLAWGELTGWSYDQ